MTKQQIKKIIKRLSYIVKMQKSGLTEIEVYISKQKEKIVIDEDVLTVLDIVDEIIEKEELLWRKKIFKKIRNGCTDISIITESPIERTKFYNVKNELVDIVFHCCIFKDLVEYDTLFKNNI